MKSLSARFAAKYFFISIIKYAILLLIFLAGNGWCAEVIASPAPITGVAKKVEEVPFICGSMMFPVWKNCNNRGVITDQYLPGMTHIEGTINWRYFEPQNGQWVTQGLNNIDGILPLLRERNLKLSVLPFLMYPPEWFKKTADYAPLMNMKTGQAVDSLSPWAPGTAAAFDHFFEGLARLYKDKIDIIKLGYPGTDFGEVGLGIGCPGYLSTNPDSPFPQDPAAWKEGYWCGDRFARADFQAQMLAKYGSLEQLNSKWGTAFSNAQAIEFPDPDKRAGQDRRWVDFISWMQEAQVRNLAVYLRVIRKHFPHTMLDVPMGFGSDSANLGCDRTAICRVAADFKPITIRSTHGSFNREGTPRAYWFYKRMSPVVRRTGVGFGTEPPGGDVTKDEMRRQMFEDASAGMNYVFHYFQNYHVFPDVVGDYKRILRPQEQPLVDIGVLYPTTQMMLDLLPFPEGQLAVCNGGREFFDYDIVDENMIGWGMSKEYKVILHTGGKVFRQETFPALKEWLNKGGVLVTRGVPHWKDLDGATDRISEWLGYEEAVADLPGVHVYRIGRGRLYAVQAEKMPEYLPKVVEILRRTAKACPANAPLHGFDGKDDHRYVTDFPSGRLIFDTQSLTSEFIPKP